MRQKIVTHIYDVTERRFTHQSVPFFICSKAAALTVKIMFFVCNNTPKLETEKDSLLFSTSGPPCIILCKPKHVAQFCRLRRLMHIRHVH